MDADIAILTETWLRDSDLDALGLDFVKGAGFCLLARNREPNDKGVSYGGVALLSRESLGVFREVKMKNPDGMRC